MKVLHTADWHLGKKLEHFSRLEEQRAVLEEICTIADKEAVDAVLVAGDLFDGYNPSTEATELFYKTLKKLARDGERPVIAIAGNHDSPDRIEVPDPLARECGILLAGYPDTEIPAFSSDYHWQVSKSCPGFLEVTSSQWSFPLRILHTSYANEFRLKTFLGEENSEIRLREILSNRWKELVDTYCDGEGLNVLMTHLFMMQEGQEVPEEPEDEKPVLHVGGVQPVYSSNIPEGIHYTALGHLHRYQEIKGGYAPVVYSGSPLGYSFHEAMQDKYVVILDGDPSNLECRPVQLTKGKKLVRKKFEDIDETVQWLQNYPDCLVELTIVSDHYLASADRKRLYQAHNGVVNIIPEIRYLPEKEDGENRNIDLNKSMEAIFKEYFIHRYGQEPNEEILDLFKEVQAVKPEEE